jgi:hypothetical protein
MAKKVIGDIVFYVLCAAGGYLAGRAIFSYLGKDALLLVEIFLLGVFVGVLIAVALKRK